MTKSVFLTRLDSCSGEFISIAVICSWPLPSLNIKPVSFVLSEVFLKDYFPFY